MAAWRFLAEINWQFIVDLFSALLTPTIATITVYIAYQQWRTNKTRLELDLYDRRLAIYKAVDTFYGEIATHGTAKYPTVFQMRTATAEAVFLFASEIERHLSEIFEKGKRLAELHEKMYPSSGEPGLPVGEARSKTAHEEGELVLWFLQEAKAESRKRFAKYLKLT